MRSGLKKMDLGNFEEAIVIKNDYGTYNILFKKQLLDSEGKQCGNFYAHAPNCTLNDTGVYEAQFADEYRSSTAYHQLCDLAHVPYDTSCDDLFKALNTVLYPDDYKSNPNRAERRGKK